MSHRVRRRVASTLAVLLTFTLSLAAQDVSLLGPAGLGPDVQPAADVESLSLPPFDGAALAKEDLARDAAGLPWRFAVPHDVTLRPTDMGTWEALPGGALLWRLRIDAPGATSLNAGFSRFVLPAGAVLWVYGADGRAVLRPFTAADNEAHGQLWTPVLFTDALVIELVVPQDRVGDVDLELTRVSQGYRGFRTSSADGSYLSGSCNVDVVCPEGDAWAHEIPAVGALQISGFLNCSGALLNDTSDSLTPYFLTAAHCGVSPGSAASVVVYWNYENSVCRPPFSGASGGSGDGLLTQFTTGSVHRASYAPSDFTLVELDDDPDPAFAVSWAGWDRSSADPPSVTAIHHPGVEEKRISFEFDPTSTTAYLEDETPGDGTHIRVEDWDVGTTEGGSSGSPLFDPQHRVVGQLHGGFASCSSQTADWYGRLSVSWNGGGTPSTRLRDWLDPGNTGALFVDTVSLDTLCSSAGEASFVAETLPCAGEAALLVVDCDLDLDEGVLDTVTVNVASPSEPAGESVLLTETGLGSGRFTGAVALSVTDAPGVLAVAPGEVLTVSYLDADDGLGGTDVLVTDTASLDCQAPLLSGISVTAVTATTASVLFTADEPSSVVVAFGTACGATSQSAASGAPALSGAVALTGLQPDTVYFYKVTGTDGAGNSTLADNGGACFSFVTRKAPKSFTEQFLGDFDLGGTTLAFTPVGGPDVFDACASPATMLPTDPTGGASHPLGDDGSVGVALGGATFPFFGTSYGTVFVGANGYVTFGTSDGDYDESFEDHFDLPRVAALYDDLNPSAGGTVSTRQLADRLAITWTNVPEYQTSNQNTFQVELFFDGRITITHLSIASTDSIVGLSAGTGVPAEFLEANLSGVGSCEPSVCQTDLGFGGPGAMTLSVCGGDLSTGTTADVLLTGAPAFATTWLVGGLTLAPAPFKGGQLAPLPPALVTSIPADAAGEVLIAALPGGGGPFTVYLQFVSADPLQVFGFGLSNAVQVEFLP